MTRVPTAEAAAIYGVAELFVDRALRRDDSLFTEGVSVWSLDVLNDLDERYVQSPDETKAKFEVKFERQLAGAPALTIQLAAEVLFVYFLIARNVKGPTKRALIEKVLSWSPQPVSIPADLAHALDGGICRTGTAYGTYRWTYLSYLIGFARTWKALPAEGRSAALSDPWRFKPVAHSLEVPGAWGQREAVLHLVFPDAFEPMLSVQHKDQIRAAYPQAPGNAQDRDQRLAEIRAFLTAPSGEFMDFYDPEVSVVWLGTKVPPLDGTDDVEPEPTQVWWVNQGQTYAEEYAGGYLWAPKANDKGRTMEAWTNMERLEVGDVIVHYANKAIRALSRVSREWQTAERPSGFERHEWEREGYKVLTHYEELAEPVPLEALPPAVRKPSQGPFDVEGGVKQRYLLEVPEEMAQALAELFGDLWPGGEIAVEKVTHISGKGGGKVERHPIYENIVSKGFSFPEWLVTDYLLSLGTKPFVLLSGISGTGKTKMAQLVAEYLAPKTTEAAVDAPELELDEGEFALRISTASLRHRGYMIPTRVAPFFTRPERGSGYDVKVALEGQSAAVHVNNIAYHPETGESTGLALTFRKDFSDWLSEKGARNGDLLRVRIDEGEPLRLAVSLVPATRSLAAKESPRIAFISVRADWTDGRAMLGYYNPLTETYVPTELLRLLLHAAAHPDEPHFVILDEMNLAKVEYYFSDFLSAMESGTEIVLHDAGETVTAEVQGRELLIPERVHVPANLLFTGTVNVDETTFMFSPKVLDRANVIQFHTVDLKGYRSEGALAAGDDEFALPASVQLDELLKTEPARRSDYVQLRAASYGCLETVNEILEAHHLHFGYRVANEIARYLGLTEKYLDKEAVPRALDLQIQQKILPKFVGNRAKLERPLWELLCYLQTGEREDVALTASTLDALTPSEAKFPESAAALQHMLQTLRQVGFASFIE